MEDGNNGTRLFRNHVFVLFAAGNDKSGEESAYRLLRSLCVMIRLSTNPECLPALLQSLTEHLNTFIRVLQETNNNSCHSQMATFLHNLLKVCCHFGGRPRSSHFSLRSPRTRYWCICVFNWTLLSAALPFNSYWKSLETDEQVSNERPLVHDQSNAKMKSALIKSLLNTTNSNQFD